MHRHDYCLWRDASDSLAIAARLDGNYKDAHDRLLRVECVAITDHHGSSVANDRRSGTGRPCIGSRGAACSVLTGRGAQLLNIAIPARSRAFDRWHRLSYLAQVRINAVKQFFRDDKHHIVIRVTITRTSGNCCYRLAIARSLTSTKSGSVAYAQLNSRAHTQAEDLSLAAWRGRAVLMPRELVSRLRLFVSCLCVVEAPTPFDTP